MTRTEAADVLRTIPAGTGSAREKALIVALEALLAPVVQSTPKAATKRKATPKAKPSRHVAAFLKMQFPEGTSLGAYRGDKDTARRAIYRDLMGHDVPVIEGVAAAQFAYGSRRTGSKGLDAAILHAAAA